MTDDIAEETAKHRNKTSHITQIQARRDARVKDRHLIANIRYGNAAYILCTCGWTAHGISTDAEWKAHKASVGERGNL